MRKNTLVGLEGCSFKELPESTAYVIRPRFRRKTEADPQDPEGFSPCGRRGRQRRAGMLFPPAGKCDSFAEVKGEGKCSRWSPEPQTVSIGFPLLLLLLFLLLLSVQMAARALSQEEM